MDDQSLSNAAGIGLVVMFSAIILLGVGWAVVYSAMAAMDAALILKQKWRELFGPPIVREGDPKFDEFIPEIRTPPGTTPDT